MQARRPLRRCNASIDRLDARVHTIAHRPHIQLQETRAHDYQARAGPTRQSDLRRGRYEPHNHQPANLHKQTRAFQQQALAACVAVVVPIRRFRSQ